MTQRRHGKHVSIAGGLHRALERGAEIGCTAIQIFSRNPRGWAARPLEDDEVAAFRGARERFGIGPVVVHDNYLINLATLDPEIRARSVEAFRDEIVRAVRLGADYLVTHPGSAKGGCAPDGVAACVVAVREAAEGLDFGGLRILIENTAGQGACIGRSFEEVGEIVHCLDGVVPIGACLDTAHTFAAGYDIGTKAGFRKTMRALGRSVGFERVLAIHFNDSKTGLGSNADRHEHLGEGRIGYDGLARVARAPELAHAAIILETPEDETHTDVWNLERLRSMLAGEPAPDRDSGRPAPSSD